MVKRLLYQNGLAILGVILYHSVGWGFTAMFAWAHRHSAVAAPGVGDVNQLYYYLMRVIEQLVSFTIPAFLFVSGFFVAFAAGRSGTNLNWKAVGVRISGLLIPYLIWTHLVLLAFSFERSITLKSYLQAIFTGGADPAFYFVPLLIQYYLLSPLIVPLARTRWQGLLLVTGAIQLIVIGLQYMAALSIPIPVLNIPADIVPKWFFPSRIFWFTAGVVVGFQLTAFKSFLARYKWVFLGAAVVLIPLGLLEWETVFRLSGQRWLDPRELITDALYAAVFILALMSFDRVRLPMEQAIGDLGTRSFGIYIVHSPVMTVVMRGIYHLFPALLAFSPLLLVIVFVAGLGVPLAAMSVVNISPARRIYAYLFS